VGISTVTVGIEVTETRIRFLCSWVDLWKHLIAEFEVYLSFLSFLSPRLFVVEEVIVELDAVEVRGYSSLRGRDNLGPFKALGAGYEIRKEEREKEKAKSCFGRGVK
jgi:hypothetical protein